jgi:exosortase A-associated hydrolase 1
MTESCLTFAAQQKTLLGILHSPENVKSKDVGVLIIVGGPQTRVGSHRQFVLLSRFLMENGIASMRFDYSGMGDSEGDDANYLDVSDDIHSAINAFKTEAKVKQVVLWGLCDAASSALIYQYHYPLNDVIGMILLNPWVRSEQGEAKTIMKHYYLNRLKDPALWRKVFSLKFDFRGSISSFSDNLKKMFVSDSPAQVVTQEKQTTDQDNYIQHMLNGLTNFQQQVLLVISGDDLTASEFLELLKSSKPWQQQIDAKVDKTHTIEQANHTFSTQQWRQEVEQVCLDWVNSLLTHK